MKIVDVRLTPLFCAFRQPYHWAQGVNDGAQIVLVEVETEAGVVGVGESVASPTPDPIMAILEAGIPSFLGEPVYDGARLLARFYRDGFNALGVGSAPRYFAQATAGLELALWDAFGKTLDQPLHRLLGGKVRDRIQYFGFAQGESATQVADHARRLHAAGHEVIYLKVGRGRQLDLDLVRAVRNAIGGARLRLDANEVWDVMTARRMFERLRPYDIEFIEQPIRSAPGARALAGLRAVVDVPIAADQSVYSPEDVYDACVSGSCDLVTLGLHECGGVRAFRRAAAIAEAAAVNVCLHGVFETGITTCVANQVAATIPNLDDGNQIMWQLLVEDLVRRPALTPAEGGLPVSELPGLGFELDQDAVKRAAEAHRLRSGSAPGRSERTA